MQRQEIGRSRLVANHRGKSHFHGAALPLTEAVPGTITGIGCAGYMLKESVKNSIRLNGKILAY